MSFRIIQYQYKQGIKENNDRIILDIMLNCFCNRETFNSNIQCNYTCHEKIEAYLILLWLAYGIASPSISEMV